ncbi:EscU/YscU/HrcU family type III secretion system export apparatus switch protein [Sphingobium aromaticiconvertens]|uniref:EscU/YscU/HrcU family type III secretion system export apparatus switch protein n=1 Tax=Sphingobium aromaticiconvertens TaxID=365341 RepID=UPI003018B9AD
MAEKNSGGDKTEKPTRKRLRDARQKGDVARSKDVAPALGMILWVILLTFATGFAGSSILTLMTDSLTLATTTPFAHAAPQLGWAALSALLAICLLVLGPAALAGVATEFLQIGVIVTTHKMKPSLDKLNPMDGLKRMFSLDNLVELLKTIIKAVLVIAIAIFILWASADDFASIVQAAAWSPMTGNGPQVAGAVLGLTRSLTLQMFGWTCGVFLLVAIADRAWVQHGFIKKLRMSRRDIKQEHKDNEGDPMMRAQRRQMHEEWANQNAIGAAGKANVLLVNPTHLAIALDFDPDDCPVPMVAAKGEGPLAAAMRAEAEREGVPIVRNIGLARNLWVNGEVNGPIPRDMFDAIAEIILWARRSRDGLEPAQREDMP